jgi:hypothetical protein
MKRILFLAIVNLLNVTSFATENCVHIGGLKACDKADRYEFWTSPANISHFFDKKELQQKARVEIANWGKAQGLPEDFLKNQKIEFWLWVKDYDASQRLGRLVVHMGKTSFYLALYVPYATPQEKLKVLFKDFWILKDKKYPETYGWQPGKVLLYFEKPISSGDTKAVEDITTGVKIEGASVEQLYGTGTYWGALVTGAPTFFEPELCPPILASSLLKSYVKSCVVNQYFEGPNPIGKLAEF